MTIDPTLPYSATASIPPPPSVGRYRILRELGRGGMGVVYEAENTWTGRRVALKLMVISNTPSEERVARFQREARVATRAEHPGIVDVLDMGREGDAFYIVQELLVGEDLGARLTRTGPMSPNDAVDVLCPVLEALAHAHTQGVVHRDIKPSNIFLARTTDGRETPKLIDFGISKALDDEGSMVETRTGQTVGTPGYMSPEQLRGERGVDPRSDLWSVGVVLYELLSGRLPWAAPNYNLMVFQVLGGRSERLSSVAPTLPRSICALVERALDMKPERRFASAGEFLSALRAWRSEATPDADRATPTPSIPSPSVPPADTYISGDEVAVPARAATTPEPARAPTPEPARPVTPEPAAIVRNTNHRRTVALAVAVASALGLGALGLSRRAQTVAAPSVAPVPSVAPSVTPVMAQPDPPAVDTAPVDPVAAPARNDRAARVDPRRRPVRTRITAAPSTVAAAAPSVAAPTPAPAPPAAPAAPSVPAGSARARLLTPDGQYP